MKSQNIDVGIADGIATLSLNRAPVNALTSAYLQEFAGCLKDLAADDDIRAVVVQSAFSVFSAGLDLKEAQGLSIDQQSEIVRAFDQTFFTAYGFPKPMIAAVPNEPIEANVAFFARTGVLADSVAIVSAASAFRSPAPSNAVTFIAPRMIN